MVNSNVSALATSNKDSKNETSSEYEIVPIEGGYIFASSDDDQTVTIVIDDDLNVEYSMAYQDEPNIIYELNLTADNLDELDSDFTDIDFWRSVEEICYGFIDEANIINYYDYVTISTPMIKSTSQDLRDFVESKHLYPEGYSAQLRYTNTTSTYAYNVMRVYEVMVVDYTSPETFSINQAISISSFITGSLSLLAGSKIITAIAAACKIVAAASTLIPAGRTIVYYEILINWYRYVTINGSSYAYNITDKWCRYDGFEDLSTTEGVQITSTPDTWYSDSSTYFSTYSSQCDDAYDMFLSIGQQS